MNERKPSTTPSMRPEQSPYGAGLAVAERLPIERRRHRQSADTDRGRTTPGRWKSLPLPPQLLEILGADWRAARPGRSPLPGRYTGKPVSVARNCTISSTLSTTGSFLGSRAATIRASASVRRFSETPLTSVDVVTNSWTDLRK